MLSIAGPTAEHIAVSQTRQVPPAGGGTLTLARGSGLTGLRDRIEALGGTLHITSPLGTGTTLLIQIPAGRHSTPGPPEP